LMHRALIDPQGITQNVIVVAQDSDYPLLQGWRLDDPALFPMPVVPAALPLQVSPRQMKLAMLGAGLLDKVDAFVASQSRAVQISWTETIVFDRFDPMLDAMAQAFGLSGGQVDDLFRAAAAI
jgi:hypothetical protein